MRNWVYSPYKWSYNPTYTVTARGPTGPMASLWRQAAFTKEWKGDEERWKHLTMNLSTSSIVIGLVEEVLHQLRLVVYPIIYKVLYIPGGAGFLPSTVSHLKTKVREKNIYTFPTTKLDFFSIFTFAVFV